MVEKNVKLGNNVKVCFKQASEDLKACFGRVFEALEVVLDDNRELRKRVVDAEFLIADLSVRLDNAELRTGLAKTCRVAEGTFTNVPQIEEVLSTA
jgi:translation initiation factor 2 alpha subunit (eIF-2alpha)